MRRALSALAAFALALALALGLAVFALSEPLPEGEAGPEADARARAMLAAVDAEAWAALGAVRWTFAGRNAHLWDKRRHLARVRWGDTEALVDLSTARGVARQGGRPLEGRRAERAVARAHAAWVNDSFWLNPVVKAFDEGTERRAVGPDAVLVQYRSGGLTPGDAYLWQLGPDGLPVAWRLWVSVVPVGGLRVSWEGWTRLPGGALVSTRHRVEGPGWTLALTEVSGAATLGELEPGPDPFAALGL